MLHHLRRTLWTLSIIVVFTTTGRHNHILIVIPADSICCFQRFLFSGNWLLNNDAFKKKYFSDLTKLWRITNYNVLLVILAKNANKISRQSCHGSHSARLIFTILYYVVYYFFHFVSGLNMHYGYLTETISLVIWARSFGINGQLEQSVRVVFCDRKIQGGEEKLHSDFLIIILISAYVYIQYLCVRRGYEVGLGLRTILSSAQKTS